MFLKGNSAGKYTFAGNTQNHRKCCLEDVLQATDMEPDIAMAASESPTVLAIMMHAPVVASLSARIIRQYDPIMVMVSSPLPLSVAVSADEIRL
ncbi:hypothetical protein PEC302107_13140 [Pectobacterium araliae]|nr:hypothetical protein PEC302107_13140 [Pectobacterium carotovorum subsp. carotovorum]